MLSTPTTEVPGIMEPTAQSLMAPTCSNMTCSGGINCTENNPGATILSPILLSMTGVTGQVWALCYLYGSSARRHNARTVFYVFLCTLIWTDFLGKMLTTPLAIISYAVGRWVGGKAMCDYHGFTMVLFSLLTHFTVSTMAIERFLGICQGYFYSRNVTPSRCRYLMICIWGSCMVFSLLPLFDVGELYLQYPGTWCFANIHLCPDSTPLRHRLYTIALGVINITNLLIIVSCNVVVVGTLLRMRLSRQLPARLCQPHRSRKHSDHELQMVVLLVVITCVFVTSWAPLDIIIVSNQLWKPHLNTKDHIHELIAVRLASINQIVDPWVYIICRVVFRSRVWKCCRLALVGRGWSKRFGERNSASFNFASFLQARKLSRNHSPPRDDQPSLRKGSGEQVEEEGTSRLHPTKTTRVPSLQRSYYSDSGTGSFSGVEVPLIESPGRHSLSPDIPLHGRKATTLQHSLAKSLSVVIPIPLFTSEQYRVAGGGGREAPGTSRDTNHGYDILENGDTKGVLQVISRPVHRVASSPTTQDHAASPFLAIQGNDVGNGVLRSNSWSCRSEQPAWPQYRTQSTQTLSLHHYLTDDFMQEPSSVPKMQGLSVSGNLQSASDIPPSQTSVKDCTLPDSITYPSLPPPPYTKARDARV
ncbi:prostaglandin E2 receptor EP4 subtype [Procambarus clarkii]|uniref:prostaglandin E2 receptor EP4 subtype n=1 Tax=Procambarus clarkii TaxID=6728 RepID=UPI001E677607|nr:prostaglandin E2 receptor EP4 subtype-like [Procambarus clarkii]XP_045614062.1 prostaglandin E2 receptor EP4 subtype-like [Procambarus clarkii]XP_045614064.1 prostaglandin E2 receptor EP4 subtype-like [Procambarus clarkii]XP_045614065.1 prostaglandin E2 receptor EP4 subtype-like [Procambarus clarkii]